MKNIVKAFAAVGMLGMMMTSCDNDEFLTVTQYNILQPDVQFSSDDNARMGLNGIYAYNNVSPEDNSWGYKPNMFTGSHPTMDTQCTGWDVKFLDQTWDDGVGELGEGWSHCYAAISRANLFLSNLEKAAAYNEATKMGITKECRKLLGGETKALRGYFYSWLATTFGRVPMLMAGEDYSSSPVKASAETYDEMWDFIISDFKDAADSLDWQPYGGQKGRCTKGMALAYLADAYMWKAYRQGCDNLGTWTEAQSNAKADVVTDCYKKAQAALKLIIDEGPYSLASNFATNWDPRGFWNEECIWAMCSDEGNQYSSWGGDRTITFCNPNMFKWFTACTNNGGWGAQYLSWEWYACYEPGDLRRDASCVTGNIPDEDLAKYNIEPGKYKGVHPYLKDVVGPDDELIKHFHCGNGELAPSIWTTKYWRNAYANRNDWGVAMWSPTIVYGKRYANVLLDYAECCFRLNDPDTGWEQINTLRRRAWGNDAVGKDYSSYCDYFNNLYKDCGVNDIYKMDVYPFTVDAPNPAPDAKTYYTDLAAKENRAHYKHTSPAWKVAVNEERRKEFNSEWCLCPDMIKSGYIEDHINYNYPKDDKSGNELRDYPWTHRVFDYDPRKMDMPIPSKEILKNSAIKQNPAYRAKD